VGEAIRLCGEKKETFRRGREGFSCCSGAQVGAGPDPEMFVTQYRGDHLRRANKFATCPTPQQHRRYFFFFVVAFFLVDFFVVFFLAISAITSFLVATMYGWRKSASMVF